MFYLTFFRDFYESQDLNQFSIPETVLQPGLHITCKFSGIWHRGIIKKIGSRKLTVNKFLIFL